jgi:hypothetical protein
VWSEAVIDNFPVVSEWRGGIKADEKEYPSQEWLATHVRASQYFLQIVKCDNEECCALPTSSLKTVLREGFFPAPLMVTNTRGLKVTVIEENASNFLSLFQRLAMNVSHPQWSKKSCVPYDICCPTIKDAIEKRTCNICDLYLPSQVMVLAHKVAMHPRVKVYPIQRTRPIRVAATRQRELMAIIASGEMEDVEWIDESHVDMTGLVIPSQASTSLFPLLMDSVVENPWES